MNSQFESELRKRIGEQVEQLHTVLMTPSAVPDFETYKFLVGQLFALDRLVQSFADINQTINNR